MDPLKSLKTSLILCAVALFFALFSVVGSLLAGRLRTLPVVVLALVILLFIALLMRYQKLKQKN